MKNNLLTKSIAGAVLFSSLIGLGHAGVISDTASFNLGSNNFYDYEQQGSNNPVTTRTNTATINLDGFDSSLGTLTGVSIAFDTDWSLNGTIQAWDHIDQWWFLVPEHVAASGTAGSTMTATLSNPSGASEDEIRSVTRSCSGSGSFSASCSSTTGISGSFNDSLDLTSLSLAAFLDTTLVLEFERELTAEVDSCGAGSHNDDRCRMQNFGNDWLGNATVTYTYDALAVAVSEPGTVALFGIGLIGLGLARRRTHG